MSTVATMRRILFNALRHTRTPPRPLLPRRTFASVAHIGQPTPLTHPHLLKPDEVTPGITHDEYTYRRTKLAATLPDGAVAIIPSATMKYRSGPVFYEFHQDPDFYYLTGFLEPDAVAVIQKTAADGEHVFHMFLREKDPHAELWDGPRTGLEKAVELFNADKAYDIAHLSNHLAPIIRNATCVYVDKKKLGSPVFALHTFTLDSISTIPLREIMHRIRAVKSGTEASVMRKAGRFSGRAFQEAMRLDFDYEHHLASFLEYQFKRNGCETSAYVPVVAGGANALTMHYTTNNMPLHDGDLVLVDAGGQYGGYAADISRTWPVNGKFTDAQRDLYTAVLNVQRECVKLCRQTAGVSLNDIHDISRSELTGGLKQLGFDVTEKVMSDVLYPHHVGHYLGVDLHDCASYGRVKKLEQGNVVTIEPGVYIPDDERWPKAFRGMGIRIEDSVYVGEEFPVVLSAEAPKEIDDIEALRE